MLALAAIVGMAIALRVWGIQFGLPLTQARPDESRVVNLASRIAAGDPNPHYFVYPSLFLYLIAGSAKGLSAFHATTADAAAEPGMFLIARGLSAALGSASVLIIFLIARRLAGTVAGLASAAVLAGAFLHVRDSHFGTTDVAMTCVLLLALLTLLSRRATIGDVALCGVVAGLATSIKYNAALIAAAAAFLEIAVPPESRRSAGRILGRLVVLSAAMAAGFVAGTPYSVVERATFMEHLRFIAAYEAGGHVHDGAVLAVPRAWAYYGARLLPDAVGWPVLVCGVAGLVFLVWRNWRVGLACALFPALYFVAASRGETVFARYMIPMVPLLSMGAGCVVGAVAAAVPGRPAAWTAATVLLALLLLPTVRKSIALDRLLARDDNRVIAGRWVDAHASGASVCVTGSVYGQIWSDAGDVAACPADISSAPLRDYIVVQRSPLHLYSGTPEDLADVLGRDYTRVESFNTGLGALRETDYDRSDAFFIPLRRLDAISRPGPEFDIYARRDSRGAGRR